MYASRASGFASGKPLDVAPGCLTLGQFAEEAAGDDDRYQGASDDEHAGAICAWDRVEAYASSRKHAAVRYHSDTPDSTGKKLPGRQQRLNAKLSEISPTRCACFTGTSQVSFRTRSRQGHLWHHR